ncbi:MAG: hypothetical protein AB7U20_23170 [Planctomycetaceae bacterium]
MRHRLTIWSVIAVLLACPQLCRARQQGCCAHPPSTTQPCCERCAAEDQTGSDGEFPSREDSESPCSDCCLCKGAVLSSPAIDLTPGGDSLLVIPTALAIVTASLSNGLLRVSHGLDGTCGVGARIALCSWRC